MSQMTHASRTIRDERFELEALPWIDDVYRFALSMTHEEADADDVVQDTYLRAYKSWHTYVPRSDCRRWLFTICRNVFLRSRERQSHIADIDDTERDALAVAETFRSATSDCFDDVHARMDVGAAIERALARVPEPFQSTLMLVDVEDQSYEVAAEVLGVPIGTVRSRLFRGRRIMQEHLLVHAVDAGLLLD